MVISKNEIKWFLIAAIFAFQDILNNGNYNLIYLLALVIIVVSLKNKTYYYREMSKLFLPLLLLVLGTYLFSGISQTPIKIIAYLAKMFVNISLMIYIRENMKRINYLEFSNKLWNIYFLLLVLSLILNSNNELWRLNDTINGISKVRLQFFYSEPSVLANMVAIMIIMILYRIIIEDGLVGRYIIKLGILSLILILTFALSGIVFCVIGVAALIIMNLKDGKIKRRVLLISLLTVVGVIVVLSTDNPVSQRFYVILSGSDASFNFRWVKSVNSIGNLLEKSNYFGIGMGNMRTDVGSALLLDAGIDHYYANSFLYFIAENGIPGLIYIVAIIYVCIKTIHKQKHLPIAKLKFGLLIYIVLYQLAGGYFTDPINWCIYGFICSKDTILSENRLEYCIGGNNDESVVD